MKSGESLEGRLLYPVYVDNEVAIPAGAVLKGTVVRLDGDRSRRIHARLRGDFTPFHTPVVSFDQLVLTDGSVDRIVSDKTTNGIPLLRLSPPSAPKKGSAISRQIDQEKQRIKDAVAQVKAPGKGDRLLQLIYSQLPYHPERINAGTSWTVALAQPVEIQVAAHAPESVATAIGAATKENNNLGQPTEWRLRAYLQRTVSSSDEKPGNTFQAKVSEPIFNAEHILVVPQGSILTAEVTQSKRARLFGRQGKLRFHFRELKLPSGFSQPVEGTLAGIDSDKSANLQLDPEGGIQPKVQNKVVVPLLLTFLAGRAFDDDGIVGLDNAVASNGFGLVGRIVGVAANSRNVAAGIGLYGAALAFYDLWLARGRDVVFVKNTRIEVTTVPRGAPMGAAN